MTVARNYGWTSHSCATQEDWEFTNEREMIRKAWYTIWEEKRRKAKKRKRERERYSPGVEPEDYLHPRVLYVPIFSARFSFSLLHSPTVVPHPPYSDNLFYLFVSLIVLFLRLHFTTQGDGLSRRYHQAFLSFCFFIISHFCAMTAVTFSHFIF